MHSGDWYGQSVMATEEATIFTAQDKQLWELWTVEMLDSGTVIPKRLGAQLGNDFAEAVADWAESNMMEDYVDPLTMSFSGMPLATSYQEASQIAQQYRTAQ